MLMFTVSYIGLLLKQKDTLCKPRKNTKTTLCVFVVGIMLTSGLNAICAVLGNNSSSGLAINLAYYVNKFH